MFGVYDEGSGLTLRGTFIINPEGVLLGSEVNFYNLGRNIDEMMRKFKANIYLAQEDQRGLPVQVEGRRRQDARQPGRQDGRQGPRGPERVTDARPGTASAVPGFLPFFTRWPA